jgi:hypothetical protein
VLLLGDKINDIDTIRHLPTGVTALKIGFANRCFFWLDTCTGYDYVHDSLEGALCVCVCL